MSDVLSPPDALVAVMIAISAADEVQSTEELVLIDRIIDTLPCFADYDKDRVRGVSEIVRDLFSEEDGLDALLDARACDVAATDGKVKMTELKFLEMLRHDLGVGRLASAAIERAARARYQRF